MSLSTAANSHRKTSPSRLAPAPSLRPAPSLLNLHIHGHSVEPISLPSAPPISQALESSASSVFTVDPNEGILLQSDTETEEAEDIAVLSRESDVEKVDNDSKKVLRDQLRRTLNRKASVTGGVFCPTYNLLTVLLVKQDIMTHRSHMKGKLPHIHDTSFTPGNQLILLSLFCNSDTTIKVPRYSSRQYYILTDAGKPVFIRYFPLTHSTVTL